MGLDVIYNAFISSFCKVEFLCYAGSPNWLGWGVLGIGVIILILIFNAISGASFMSK